MNTRLTVFAVAVFLLSHFAFDGLAVTLPQPIVRQVSGQEQHKLNRFVPGEIWPDNNGIHINAHGGGIMV